jgi:cell division protein FtsZ
LVNLDFADVRTIMTSQGKAIMGTGLAQGESRAVAAAQRAIESPLLEASVHGARGVLINITGGSDMSLFDVHEAASAVQLAAHPEAQIIFGAVIDEHMDDTIRVTVIATGFVEAPTEDLIQVPAGLRRRPDLTGTNGHADSANATNYEVHEKFDQEAYARWQAFAKHASAKVPAAKAPEPDATPEERALDVPAFFRRRPRRR